ncbi:hypothetical protein BEN47_06210 [Hymenobacter lapidarius]|uniref:Uncharacterized protein n=1 Tax=Hymenobacter lapidarius TaxID=1908237 RepID=A0A1G1SQF8_9BACT|nr:hypothetical protein [Hymenobacter lapidarius]OGX80848.1 hypothetical protein BEN47_06210 [Hymenobacter lapidarius]
MLLTLLQTAELTTAATQAASAVSSHAETAAFTALLWLLVVVFGGVSALLIYKLIWKDKPATASEVDVLRTALTELRAAFEERKKSMNSARMQDKLKIEADLAAVACAINKLADTAESLTTMTERVSWHGKLHETHRDEFRAVHEELKEVKRDIKDLGRERART